MVIRQMVITMAAMFVLNATASSVGGNTRKIIKGEQSFFERLFG